MTKAWEEHRQFIIKQYKEENKPLHEVQRIMEETYKFKASTRAYRSRFDKWGIHKYSCRKRGDSNATGERPSPPSTPELDDSDNSPLADSDSAVSPQNSPYFSPGIGGTTPPADMGSPLSQPVEYGQQPPYNNQQHIMPPPPIRHTMSLPNPGFGPGHHQYRFPFSHHHHHHHHHHQSQQQHFSPQPDYFRQHQGPVPVSASPPASPHQRSFARTHSDNGSSGVMSYGGYSHEPVGGGGGGQGEKGSPE